MRRVTISCSKLSFGLWVAAGLFVGGFCAQAVEYSWTAGSGENTDWSTAGNWSPAGVPGSGDVVLIGEAEPLMTGGSREVSEFKIEPTSGAIVQVVGTGGETTLRVKGTLLHRRQGPMQISVVRGHTTMDGGRLAVHAQRLESTGGQLFLGQYHEQRSRALTGLEIGEETLIDNGSRVSIFTDGQRVNLGDVRFGEGGGMLFVANGMVGSRSVTMGSLDGTRDAVLAVGDEPGAQMITTLRMITGTDGGNFAGTLRDFDEHEPSGSTLMVVKTGPGEQILSGPNEFSGALIVHAGILRINGNQSSSRGPVRVGDGAVLGGFGTIGGSVQVEGVLLSDGMATGMRIEGDLRIGSGATVRVRRSAERLDSFPAFTGSEDVSVTLGGTLEIEISEGEIRPGMVLPLFSDWGKIKGNFKSVKTIGAEGIDWDTSKLNEEGILTAKSAP